MNGRRGRPCKDLDATLNGIWVEFLSVDSTGVFCGTRRLHHRRFHWPESPQGRQKLTAGELAYLLVGGDVKKFRFKRILSGS